MLSTRGLAFPLVARVELPRGGVVVGMRRVGADVAIPNRFGAGPLTRVPLVVRLRGERGSEVFDGHSRGGVTAEEHGHPVGGDIPSRQARVPPTFVLAALPAAVDEGLAGQRPVGH